MPTFNEHINRIAGARLELAAAENALYLARMKVQSFAGWVICSILHSTLANLTRCTLA